MSQVYRQLLGLASEGGSFWFPPQASTRAENIDFVWYFIYWLCVIFFVLIVGAMVHFVVKYRRRSEDQKTSPLKGNHRLEAAWSIIPGILLVVIFLLGFRSFVDLSVAPADSIEIRVTAQRWAWTFDYGDFPSDQLVVPVNQPVRMVMSSTDVLHSFYVPAFRVKQDVLPNRYTQVWFEATQTGEYDIFCAEYCGTDHSSMHATVRVVEDDEYQAWLDTFGGLDPTSPTYGPMVFRINGCAQCHTFDGSVGNGPTLQGIWGRTEHFTDGSSLEITGIDGENYLRDSMMSPNTLVVDGFRPGVMPTFRGRLTEEMINGLIDYIKADGVTPDAEATEE